MVSIRSRLLSDICEKNRFRYAAPITNSVKPLTPLAQANTSVDPQAATNSQICRQIFVRWKKIG